ncbi:MAG: SRPBCC domain-containing protein [Acidobacteria bacterium]|nr:SRPBCC domain-containing protein [Acidobacteriota bacterium]
MSAPAQPREAKRMSDAAVQAKTGKTWKEWFAILDKAGARKMDHKQIVAYLVKHQNVGPWWQQMVTVNYEQARGLREKHQTSEGFTANGSRTIAVALPALFQAWQAERARRRWLGDAALTIRTATPPKSLRILWGDGKSRVDVMFYAKGKGKSQVTVDHRRLTDAKEAARMKTYWSQALDRLKATLQA